MLAGSTVWRKYRGRTFEYEDCGARVYIDNSREIFRTMRCGEKPPDNELWHNTSDYGMGVLTKLGAGHLLVPSTMEVQYPNHLCPESSTPTRHGHSPELSTKGNDEPRLEDGVVIG